LFVLVYGWTIGAGHHTLKRGNSIIIWNIRSALLWGP
jgi:hypothetical protein